MKTKGFIAEAVQEKMILLGRLGFTYEESIEMMKEVVNETVANMNRNQMRIV